MARVGGLSTTSLLTTAKSWMADLRRPWRVESQSFRRLVSDVQSVPGSGIKPGASGQNLCAV